MHTKETVFEASLDKSTFVQHNKEVIFEALKAAGIRSVTLEYFGEGDDGQGFEMTTAPAAYVMPSEGVTLKQVSGIWDPETKWQLKATEHTYPLDDAVMAFGDTLMEVHGHRGYENGDGGCGTITFDVEARKYEHDHYDTIVEHEHTVHEG
ncbi:MAG: DUF6878 family protein [Nitrososphaera sp.]